MKKGKGGRRPRNSRSKTELMLSKTKNRSESPSVVRVQGRCLRKRSLDFYVLASDKHNYEKDKKEQTIVGERKGGKSGFQYKSTAE